MTIWIIAGIAYIVIGVTINAISDAINDGESNAGELIMVSILWPAVLVVAVFVLLYEGIKHITKGAIKRWKKGKKK